MKEEVILVNNNDQEIGTMGKMESHMKGSLHRAISVFIFNSKNEMLLQRRSLNKYHTPGLWSNTACSHPRPKEKTIEGLKITVRLLDKKDVAERKLPKGTTGVVITKIEKDSPLNYLEVNNIIVEAQKRKINTIGDLNNIVKMTLRSSEKTLLIAIYNNQNQRRYIGVKLD